MNDAMRNLLTLPDASQVCVVVRYLDEADEIVDVVAYLASNVASYINGHNMVVDGGGISGFSQDP